MVKLASTMLLRLSGVRAAVPPPGVESAEALWAAVVLKNTFSPNPGAPGNCQFNRSDQFVLRLGTSAPTQSTAGLAPTGPLVTVSNTAVWSPLRLTWAA